jgi:hypothetical protein
MRSDNFVVRVFSPFLRKIAEGARLTYTRFETVRSASRPTQNDPDGVTHSPIVMLAPPSV